MKSNDNSQRPAKRPHTADNLAILNQGVEVWNEWRKGRPLERIDLSFANLARANLQKIDLSNTFLLCANLSDADLRDANFSKSDLFGADLQRSDLRNANLDYASLSGTKLNYAKLSGARLFGSSLIKTDMTSADLSEAFIVAAVLLEANLESAVLDRSYVHGVSVWKTNLKDAKQNNLIITDGSEPTVTCDNLELAQFVYLLLYNERIGNVIDSITSKVVLILGRFSEERKRVLDALRDDLRNRDYSPVLFDFDKPVSKTTGETISTLAGIACFVIADITDAKSVLQEIERIVPKSPSLPIQPIQMYLQEEPGMFDSFKPYPWFLPVFRYRDLPHLLASMHKVIAPAEQMVREIKDRSV